jgi:hypothetical protein
VGRVVAANRVEVLDGVVGEAEHRVVQADRDRLRDERGGAAEPLDVDPGGVARPRRVAREPRADVVDLAADHRLDQLGGGDQRSRHGDLRV